MVQTQSAWCNTQFLRLVLSEGCGGCRGRHGLDLEALKPFSKHLKESVLVTYVTSVA